LGCPCALEGGYCLDVGPPVAAILGNGRQATFVIVINGPCRLLVQTQHENETAKNEHYDWLLRGNGGCAVDIAHRGVVCGIKLLIYKEK
jgi:hypothetical protein